MVCRNLYALGGSSQFTPICITVARERPLGLHRGITRRWNGLRNYFNAEYDTIQLGLIGTNRFMRHGLPDHFVVQLIWNENCPSLFGPGLLCLLSTLRVAGKFGWLSRSDSIASVEVYLYHSSNRVRVVSRSSKMCGGEKSPRVFPSISKRYYSEKERKRKKTLCQIKYTTNRYRGRSFALVGCTIVPFTFIAKSARERGKES
jgi:hypothetical protein